MEYIFTQKPRSIVFKRAGSDNRLFISTLETLNFKVSHIKVIQDSNKTCLHIIAFLNNGFLFESGLMEVDKNLYCGYWKNPAAKDYRFFIIRLMADNKLLFNYYPQRPNKANEPIELARKEIKKRGL